jgi:lysophospholipase L1-like esterase
MPRTSASRPSGFPCVARGTFARALVATSVAACSRGSASPGTSRDSGTATGDSGVVSAGGDDASARADSGGRAADGGTSTMSGAGDAGTGGVIAGGVRWIGRVDASNPSAVKFAWSGTGFAATVQGTRVSVTLQSEGSAAFFQSVIDAVPGKRIQVPTGPAQTVVLGDALSAGDHVVELYRDTEGMYGDTIFSGFVDGTLKAPPVASGRLIEVVGDSISAGYGNLGNEVHPPYDNTCTFTLDTEAAYQAYDSVIGRTLGAEVSIVARSGWGMVRDLNGNTSNVLPSVYEDTVGTQGAPAWNFARKADAVLINLGTNDSAMGDPGQPYEDAYVAFLHAVRGHYPDASIFLTIGPMTSDPTLTQMRTHLANVVSKMNDGKVTAIDLLTQDTTMTGCDYHPDVAEDVTMAGMLAPTIKAKLAW